MVVRQFSGQVIPDHGQRQCCASTSSVMNARLCGAHGTSPSSWPSQVVIRGHNLCQATGVDFGKTAATSFSVSTPAKGVCHVTAASPAGTGVVGVTVLSPGGHSLVAFGKKATFTYK
jgi:hypothetical protein